MENLVDIGLFHGVYRGKKVLVTGHTGFKGSWLCCWLSRLGAEIVGFADIIPTQPNHFELLHLPITTIWGDIGDTFSICKAIHDYQPDIVFHLAAQSLVLKSYQIPQQTYMTNLMGTLNLYEACRAEPSVRVIVTVTTDKVYHNQEWCWGYRENDALGGHDPYSSSKACVELMSQSYRDSFFKPKPGNTVPNPLMATVRAGNVIGGGDWAEYRLIPDIVRAASQKQPVIIRSPQAVRPWQHVLEPLAGYLWLGALLLEGRNDLAEAWNFGPHHNQFKRVEEMVHLAQSIWPDIHYKIESNPFDSHETGCLRLDSSKASAKLQWQPVWTENGIEYTIGWYQAFYGNQSIITDQNISEYVQHAIKQNVIWVQA